jgi:plasmid stabilization system protein ParE
MSFNVKTISVFERQAKRLLKKFPSLKKELQTLISELKEEPEKGTLVRRSVPLRRFYPASGRYIVFQTSGNISTSKTEGKPA